MRTIIVVTWFANRKLSIVHFLCIFLLCLSLQYCAATDTITTSSSIRSRSGETLISAGKRFELGFFSPDGHSSIYVGIWYYMRQPKVIVWVANGDKPLPDFAAGIFSITDGNLVLLDDHGTSYFSTGLGSSPYSRRTTAKLLDSGNLVLTDDRQGNGLWTSFDHPTDTFLPGMKMDETLKLTSWRSHDDPGAGNFTFEQDDVDNHTTVIWKRSSMYWRSGESGKFIRYTEMPNEVEFFLSNFSKLDSTPTTSIVASGKLPLISYPTNWTISSVMDYNCTRLVMNSSGEIQFWNISRDNHIIWSAPGDQCSVYNFCGYFGSCNSKNRFPCKCLPGFKPNSLDAWNSRDFSAGCARKSLTSNNDTFLSLKKMKVGKPEPFEIARNETDCREECLGKPECEAYSYNASSLGRPDGCWLWNSALSNLEEEQDYGRGGGGCDLYVRVAPSDIGSTSRSCGTCGTNIIPYPLSTGSNCGDPMYFSFLCTISSGQVSFETPNGTFRVSSIEPETHKFVIQVKDAEINCKNPGGKILQLHPSLPFHLTNRCYIDPSSLSFNTSLEGSNEVEISWDPPQEPTCNSSAECKDWPNSSCKAREEDGKSRCLCNANYHWDGPNLICARVSGKTSSAAEVVIIIIAVIIVVSFFCSITYLSYRRRIKTKRRGSRESIQRNQAIQFYDIERRVKNLIDSAEFKEDDKKGIDVPFFNLESILAATDYFSEVNKLGQGGFGPVYKGEFAGGQEIAVKRLSIHSGQGLEEFKNEVVLIAKLQHRNLVRLLGYCVKGDEKILLYEYMRNKSLDGFIFDRTLCMLLDWEKRFDIILGIARGLLYLHQDSRLKIIHRDLKTSNILLDEEMNPKISDFGLARIVGAKETEANTTRVVGTYGYMSPEYALDGLFSIKSDVFSFGVILLEIVSGKRNTGFYRPQQAFNLLGHAWRLWREEKALDLMDKTLLKSCNRGEVLKCIIVGLLCVQEDPGERPNMSNVVFMLGGETATLSNPKEPAFVAKKWSTTPSSSASSSKPETFSNNELTVSMEDGR